MATAGADHDEAEPRGESRRSLIRKIGVGVAAWTVPTVVSAAPAAAQGTPSTCPEVGGETGYFGWTTTAGYVNGQRTGAPGGANPMNSVSGWTGHPTYQADTLTGPTTGISITFRLVNTTYLNTTDAGPPSQGHGVAATGTSTATFPSYRVSKGGNVVPPLNDSMGIEIIFSAPVYCVSLDIGDLDNSLPAGTTTAFNAQPCAGGTSTSANRWADGLTATAAAPGGAMRTVERIAAPGGTNVLPAAVSSNVTWYAINCDTVPQTSDLSNFRLQAGGGPIERIQLNYLTGFQTPNPAPNGNQHIAFGNISFTYF